VRNRAFLIVVLTIAGLLAGAGALLVYDSSQRNAIANGITVGGIDIGGLSASQARARLRAEYLPRLRQPIVARFHAHRFVVTPRAAHVAVDIDGTVEQALQRSRDGTIFARVIRSLTGGHVNALLEPRITFSRSAVDALVAQATKELNHRAQSASISYSADSLGTVPGRTGLTVRAHALSAALQRALSQPTASREITIPATVTRPAVSESQLAAEYPAIITVDRSAFELRLWKHLRLAKTYPIAVGMIGLETPAGLYHVQDKQVDPSWEVPNSPWAGSLAGQVIPPGPADPLKARWMGIFNGAGIHGIDPSEYGTIGHNASHGCIRMTIPDVIELYNQTPVGAPVYIT
jgi:lipoprotein-anchoring transpeptidase ErfK/SrfK